VRQLVGEHRFDLFVVEAIEEALRDDDNRVARASSG
jgi:hypothetical protein